MSGVQRYGNILVYPTQGRLIFATDFHGQIEDFRAVAAGFEERRAAGEDVYLLFAGDFVHGPQLRRRRGVLRPDASPRLLEELERLLERHPCRVHSLLGNHEHGHLGGPRTQKFYRGLTDDVSALEQRLGPARHAAVKAIFQTFALMALAPCGVLFCHAAPAVRATPGREVLREIATARLDRREPVVQDLLWPRSVDDSEQLERFFDAIRFKGIRPRLIVHGHDVVPQGVDVGYKQVALSTSFAVEDTRKTLLEIDLAGQYSDPADLRPGVELLPLYPGAHAAAALDSAHGQLSEG